MQDLSLKKISLISLAAMLLLLIGAFVFYRERVFFADASYILFNIVTNKSLAISENRYGSFITQMVPLLGVRLHLPIQVIIISYAISFNLFYFTVMLLLIYRHKQYLLAVLMSFYYFLLVSDSYYWLNNEIHQAVAWMFLLFGVILSSGRKNTNKFILFFSFLPLAFITIYTHFVVIIPLTFLWLFFWLRKTDWPFSRNLSFLFTLLLAGIIALKYFSSAARHGSYDDKVLYDTTHFSLLDIWLGLSKPVIVVFLQRCLTNYWLGAIVLFAGIITAFRHKHAKIGWLTIAFTPGYFVIMGLTFGKFDEHFLFFHIESEWASLSIIVAAPFLFFSLPAMRHSVATAILVAIFLVRIVYIGASSEAFSTRYRFKEVVMAQMKKKGITKLALYREDDLSKKMMLDWAVPYETIFHSAFKNEHPQPTFVFMSRDDKDMAAEITDPACFASLYHARADQLGPYVQVDTTKIYQVMSFKDLMK